MNWLEDKDIVLTTDKIFDIYYETICGNPFFFKDLKIHTINYQNKLFIIIHRRYSIVSHLIQHFLVTTCSILGGDCLKVG